MTSLHLAEQLRVPVKKIHCGGTHRAVTPQGTLARVRPLLPAMGITRVANVTGLDYLGIPVVMVVRPNSRLLAVSQGKGVDLDHAKASGVMEAIEAFHGERISLPLKLQSYDEMRRLHAVVDPAMLPAVPDSLYHPDLRILWIEGFDLMARRRVWLPYESVHVNYTLPLPEGTGCVASSTNGLASGNHLIEAVGAGICEVVERDCDALWLQLDDAALAQRLLDLADIDEPRCQEILAKYAAARFAVEVWETTSDIGLPAFRCHIYEAADNPHDPQGIFFGAGCHPTREIALLRALTEAAQSRLTYISGSRDDIERHDYRRPGDKTPVERIGDATSAPDDGQPMRRLSAAPTFEAPSLNEDLDWELERLGAAGIEQVVVVDLSIPQFDIPVVKVVIPGLEGVPDGPTYVPGLRARRAAATAGEP
ncbi:MAG TPA: YcaO-like family protein [Dongiaceae bacterium]|nr:YcaO-like family protein [Dongiaceae bacterium]